MTIIKIEWVEGGFTYRGKIRLKRGWEKDTAVFDFYPLEGAKLKCWVKGNVVRCGRGLVESGRVEMRKGRRVVVLDRWEKAK